MNYIKYHYRYKYLTDEAHLSLLERIHSLKGHESIDELKSLKQHVDTLWTHYHAQAEAYHIKWTKENTDIKVDKQWEKYKHCLNVYYYENYKHDYATFLNDCDSYMNALIEDTLAWVNCSTLAIRHPLTLTADDMARDSRHYRGFANDILMTLGMRIDNPYINGFMLKLVEDNALNGHNILWSAVFADKDVDKSMQSRAVSLLLSLDNTKSFDTMTYGDLLDKLETVLVFAEDDSPNSELIVHLSTEIEHWLERCYFGTYQHDHRAYWKKKVIKP